MTESSKLANPESAGIVRTNRKLTIPNLICVFRLIGSLAMIPLALADQPEAILVVFVILAISDWIDGKLARLLNERSVWGARLDSLADWTLYTMLLFAALITKGSVLVGEAAWLGIAAVTFIASLLYAIHKFQQLPSYHTLSAKASWLLMLIGVVALFMDLSLWPLRIALAAVMLANLESLLITSSLDRSRTDVRSWWAIRHRQ